MKTPLMFCAAAMVTILASCGVPGKYTRLDYMCASGGYKVLAETERGAEIEAYTVEYHFMPDADIAAKKAKRHFLRSAREAARGKGMNATSVLIEDGDITRNALAGTYKTVMTGTVLYGSSPSAVAAVDRSMIGDLASASARKSWRAVEASAAAGQAMSESLKESNRNQRIDSLDSAIRENTRATENLRREVSRY